MTVGMKAWSVVWLEIKLHDRRIMVRIPSRARNCYIHRNITTSSGTHPVFYPVSTLEKKKVHSEGVKRPKREADLSWIHIYFQG
jgi:hypothetical protein